MLYILIVLVVTQLYIFLKIVTTNTLKRVYFIVWKFNKVYPK